MPENLKPIARGKTIELEHDRGIERRDIAMPDVARDAGEEDVGVSAFECLRQRQLGSRMALAKIFTQKQAIDPGCVAAHDHVLVIVGENLRLNEIAWAE